MTVLGTGPAGGRVGPRPARLRLGTRRSLLARTQSQWVADRLSLAAGGAVEVELVEVTTRGDIEGGPLAELGGTGVFVSALREALLAGEIDVAVHSLKDLPTAPAAGLAPVVVPVREDPRDVLVARAGLTLATLPRGARVGTGSPRRAAQLRALGLGLDVVGVRGNVDTRLGLVADGTVDAVVLAHAGLLRLGRGHEVTQVLEPAVMMPAPGQGALAIETRADDDARRITAGRLDDPRTRACVLAERALLARLEAGCSAPVGALAEMTADGELVLQAVVGSIDGAVTLRRTLVVRPRDAATALQSGRTLAEQLLVDGADRLVTAPISTPPPLTSARAAVTAGEGDS